MSVDIEFLIALDAEEAAGIVAEQLAAAARRGGHVAVSGGETPRPAYERAAELAPDWSGVELWFADDRCVPPADPLSNYRLVRETLLARVEQPPVVHRIKGELDPEEAAAAYDEELRGVRLDLALLGIGPDAHTASLFPDAPELEETERAAVAVEAGMEPFVPRVTLTIPVLAAAPLVIYLVAGDSKAEAAARSFTRDPDPSAPASLVRSAEGRTVAVLDRAAAAVLEAAAS